MSANELPPIAPGTHRVEVTTTGLELVSLALLFDRTCRAARAAGSDPMLLWQAMAYALAVEAAALGICPRLDEPLRKALPAFALGYRDALSVQGAH